MRLESWRLDRGLGHVWVRREHDEVAYRNFAISKSNSRTFFVELGVDDSLRLAT
jgi:hypothetical protein